MTRIYLVVVDGQLPPDALQAAQERFQQAFADHWSGLGWCWVVRTELETEAVDAIVRDILGPDCWLLVMDISASLWPAFGHLPEDAWRWLERTWESLGKPTAAIPVRYELGEQVFLRAGHRGAVTRAPVARIAADEHGLDYFVRLNGRLVQVDVDQLFPSADLAAREGVPIALEEIMAG